MNLENPKYADERVRQAISLAIDRKAMIAIVFQQLGQVAATQPWTFLFDEAPTLESGLLGPWTRHDVAEAKQLLDAAGVPDLTMDNIYYQYTEAAGKWTEVLVDQFRDAGINMTGGKADYTEFNSQWINRRLPDVSSYGWQTSGFDADNWFYAQVYSESPGNRWNINDPQLDQWAEEQQLELDPEARKELWRKMWDHELKMVYRPPIASERGAFEVYQPWVRGLRFTGGPPGDNSSYYDWGDQVQDAWLDK